MIIEITKPNFKAIIQNSKFALPRRWDGSDFYETLKSLYNEYQLQISTYTSKSAQQKVKTMCDNILKTVEYYHNGFPNKAFKHMGVVMKKLIRNPLKVYRKSGWTEAFENNDPLMLYRIRNVQNNTLYCRRDIFHTPYNLRSKVSTCRYSISGYPALYLGTSLELCCEESKINNVQDFTIASRYKIERNMQYNNEMVIDVIELGIKPKDFMDHERPNLYNEDNTIVNSRRFNEIDLNSIEVMSAYLYWYPLIAACSFIRVNKNDPFAAEYIIPQLLMQWVRNESEDEKLIGIRYFSCASERISELGFNYVFPVSGEKDFCYNKYCKVLANVFKLTNPVYMHEFSSIADCEFHLQNTTEFEKI